MYIYIYDISSLRVNDLTLVLLTWRKWWAPNNASKQQMGFNSAFKGLNAELNPICHLLTLLGAHHILHVSRIRVKHNRPRQMPVLSAGIMFGAQSFSNSKWVVFGLCHYCIQCVIFWVCLCSFRYPACIAHAPYCYLWPVRLFHIFPHYLIKSTTFQRKLQNMKCVLIFSTTFVWNVCYSKKKTARHIINVQTCSCEVSVIIVRF